MGGKLHADSREILREYAKSVKENYPKLSEEDIILICKYQFIMIRRRMETGQLGVIRIKYFGSFRVFRGRVKGIQNALIRIKAKDRVTDKDFNEINEMCNKFLNNEPTPEEMD